MPLSFTYWTYHFDVLHLLKTNFSELDSEILKLINPDYSKMCLTNNISIRFNDTYAIIGSYITKDFFDFIKDQKLIINTENIEQKIQELDEEKLFLQDLLNTLNNNL